jgi:tight adherence protein C
MDDITNLLGSTLAAADDQRRFIVLTVAATVFLFGLGISFLVIAATDPVRRRLAALLEKRAHTGKFAARIAKLIEPASEYILPKNSKERGLIQRQLICAGFRSENALPLFYALKTGLALVLLLCVSLSASLLPKVSTTGLLFLAMLAAFIGMVLPNVVLSHVAERRQKRLRDGFPDALDMLVVCVEAGLGLMAAMQRVADELRYSHPDLAAELNTVTAEMRAGVDRETALRSLTHRTGLEDVRGLVSLLIQTLRFGTSVGDTLRVYSEEFRDKRMQRAEELAAKIGTKLIFPLVFCLFPSFFVVAVGPAIVRIADAFRQLGQTIGQ